MNGHASSLMWLTSVRHPGLTGFRNTISLDQVIAAKLGGTTRLPFLTLNNDAGSLAWTANGINIPVENSPARQFRTLSIDRTQEEQASQLRELRRGRSILDTGHVDARKLPGRGRRT